MVAVTGAASGVGHELVSRLADSPRVRKVVAIDDHRGPASGVTWRVTDVRDPAVATRLSDVDALVHLALDTSPEAAARERRAYNVRGAQTVVTAAAAARVRRMVLVTSATVYGAHPDNPVPLPEDAPLRAAPDTGVVGDFLEMEDLATRAAATHPGTDVTVVRPAALVGGGVDSIVTRHFEAPRLLVIQGTRPRWQFCHIDDLTSVLELAGLGDVSGSFAVGCDGWLDHETVAEVAELGDVELPASITFGTAQRLHRVGVTPAPADDLRYVVYPWVVDCATLRATGWKPAYDNEAALRVLLEDAAGRHAVAGRRVSRKDATTAAAGAAGATAAVIGAAAVARHVRRRRAPGE